MNEADSSPPLACKTLGATPPLAEVAEWQTHQLEGLTLARAWRFESSLPHHPSLDVSAKVTLLGHSDANPLFNLVQAASYVLRQRRRM